jgi:hypothetical protein
VANPVLTARNRLVCLYRFGEPSPEALADAKRNLTIAHAERAIQAVRDAEPALTKDQLSALAALLVGGSK